MQLSTSSGAEILEVFDELYHQGRTMIMVTHSDEVSARSKRVVYLRDGKIEHELRR